MNVRAYLTPKKKKQQNSFWNKLKVIFLLSLFVLAGIGFKETYGIYSTLARTPVAEASTASRILEINGTFNTEQWLDNGESGIEISNITNAKVWVYFNIEGDLIQAIQHIDAVCLEPGQSYQIPVIPANTPPLVANGRVNELGLLGWKNNEQEFSGRIIAGVLNGYAKYEIGTLVITGHDVYESFIRVKEEDNKINSTLKKEDGSQDIQSVSSISEIKSINDILLVIADKLALIKERDDLLTQVDSLILENNDLLKENSRLRNRINSLEADVDYLHYSLQGAKKQIDELQNPPATPSQPDPEQKQEEIPEKKDDQEADESNSDPEGDSGIDPGNDSAGETGSDTNHQTDTNPQTDTDPPTDTKPSEESEPAEGQEGE